MNFDRAPQLHPLKEALGIDSYNSRHLGPDNNTVLTVDPPVELTVPQHFQSIAKLSRLAASSPPMNPPQPIPAPEDPPVASWCSPSDLF